MKAQKLNQRQARQALYLSRFDFTLKHIASKSMGRADSLSRRADQTKRVERDNENQVILKKEWLEIRAIEKGQLLIEEAEEEIVEKIKKSEVKDNKVVEEMKRAGVKVLRNDKQQIEDELVLKKEKMYIPKDVSLRLEIIQLHHDAPIVGYRRQQKTVELVTRNYWWLGATKKVKKYVEGCNQCQRMKNKAEMLV